MNISILLTVISCHRYL